MKPVRTTGRDLNVPNAKARELEARISENVVELLEA
jgi:hypothetical protein